MRMSSYEDVEDALLIWFKSVLGKSIPVSGNVLQVKAEELARELGHDGFSCSGGWLQCLKNHHGIVKKHICRATASVSEEIIDRRVFAGYYAKTYQLHHIGVSVGGTKPY